MNEKQEGLLRRAGEELIKILDIDELLKIILDIAKDGLEADRGTVYVVDRTKKEIWSKVLTGDNVEEIRLPIGKGIAGQVAATGDIINIEDAYQDERFNQNIDRVTGYKTKTIICMPVRNQKKQIVGVFQLLNKHDGRFNKNDERFLHALANYSALALELAILHEELIIKEQMEHELNIAREIQVSLLPRKNPDVEGYEVYGNNISCETVSGDYYDFFQLADGRWVFAIGDVSGKGIPASLMMAGLQSHLRALLRFDTNIPEIMSILNEYIIANSTPDKYVTFFLGILDPGVASFEYVNAGHNAPITLDNKMGVRYLRCGGPLIGMFPGLVYTPETIHLDDGQLIACYTDGVTETFDKMQEEYGEARLIEFLKKHERRPLEEMFGSLVAELNAFAESDSHADDLTIIFLRKK